MPDNRSSLNSWMLAHMPWLADEDPKKTHARITALALAPVPLIWAAYLVFMPR